VRVAALCLLAGLAASCTSKPAEPPAVEAGTTTVLLANRVDPPFRLERVVLDVDGQRMPLSTVPPAGAEPATLARLRLAPGEHTLQVLASAAGPGGGDGATIATLRTAQSFQIGEAPARVSVRLSMASASASAGASAGAGNGAPRDEAGARQLDVAFQMHGGELATPVGQLGAAGDDRCKRLEPARRAVCRAETFVARARERRDLAVLGCSLDALATMRTLAAALEDARRAGDPAPDAEVIRSAEDRLVVLAHEIEKCDVPADVGALGP
jgi:hypothetical protein